MECQQATAHIAEYLTGSLPAKALQALRAHAAVCTDCRDEVSMAEETWQQLGHIPPVVPDVPAMQARFDALLASYQEGFGGGRRRMVLALAAAALLVIGVGIGRQTARPAAPAADTQMAALRAELSAMRQIMSLSLLQQQSAVARLQGVVSTGQIDDPSGDLMAALLDALRYDSNANVRLATIDALKRFMDTDLVKRAALDALPQQTSPLVQIALIDFVAESSGVESAAALRALAEDVMVQASVRTRAAQRLRELGGRL
jgi:hypothetical protein